MRITDAYIVMIDFDGDIASDVVGTYIFTTLEETKEIVKQALIDLYNKRNDEECEIMGYAFSIKDVIECNELLVDFIGDGGDFFGNWEVIIDKV